MKTATRRTALCAVLLAVLAAGAPFLCLIPLFSPAGDTADSPAQTPAAQTPAPSPTASRAPGRNRRQFCCGTRPPAGR